MVKRILVANGEKKKLVDLLETSYPTVRKALAGNLETHIAVKIRTVALERGGVEVEPKK